MKFRIYYGDGSTFEGDPFAAPGYGVQVIAWWQDGRRYLVHGKDFYWWTTTGWSGGDFAGFIQSLRRPGAQKLILGESSDDFADILKRAVNNTAEPD
jgi:hypothetical protein